MSEANARTFIEDALQDPEMLSSLMAMKGTRQEVYSSICSFAADCGNLFDQDEFDTAVRAYILDRVSNDDITLEEYRAASQHVMSTGSIICCCSFWSGT